MWKEIKIGNVLPWKDVADQAKRLLVISKADRDDKQEHHDDREQEDNQEVKGDERDPYNEDIVGCRGPDFVVVDWANKVRFVLEFKRTADKDEIPKELVGVIRGLANPGLSGVGQKVLSHPHPCIRV